MPKNKKHHYVPKFYLKRFSQDGKSIGLYNLPKEIKIEKANLSNQCYKDYFYGKDQRTEHALGAMECETSLLYRRIDKYCCLPPPFSEDHIALIVSILIQYSRTKYSAETIDEMHDKLFKETHKERIEAELIKSGIEGANIDDFVVGIEDVSQYTLSLYVKFYPHLLDLNFKLLINKTKTEFITSDNPVVMFNQLLAFRKIGSNVGMSIKGLQIFFPLSPGKLVILYDNGVYRVGGENIKVINVTSEKDIYNLNALQACSCYENIYFMNERQNAVAIHKNIKSFLRKDKANIKVFPQYDDGIKKSELVMNYIEDIKINVNLSFLTLRRSAKLWRDTFIKQKRQANVIARNQKFHDDADEFLKKVTNNELQFENFIDFLREKYGES